MLVNSKYTALKNDYVLDIRQVTWPKPRLLFSCMNEVNRKQFLRMCNFIFERFEQKIVYPNSNAIGEKRVEMRKGNPTVSFKEDFVERFVTAEKKNWERPI